MIRRRRARAWSDLVESDECQDGINQTSPYITIVHGKSITTEDVLVHLKAHGTFRSAIYDLIEMEVIKLMFDEQDIEITDAELQEYSENKRLELGINDAVEMNEYCMWLGVTYDQWYQIIEIELMQLKLTDNVIDDKKVAAYYEYNKNDLKTLSVSRIVCDDESVINQVKSKLDDGQCDFSTLAREFSIEENTNMAGGYVGSVRKGMLPEAIDEQIFYANKNDIIGPSRQNGFWTLYKIESIDHVELDDALKRHISETLFNEWLEIQVNKARA